MTQVTKSLSHDIEVLSANGLSTFVDDVDGVLKLKDTNGNIQALSDYTGGPNVNRGLFAQTATSTALTNTTTRTSIITTGQGSLSVPANGFSVGSSFVAFLSGKISSVNNETIELHFNSGGVVLVDTGLLVLAQSTNKNWQIIVNFTIRSIGGAGVASIASSGNFTYNKDSGNIPEGLGFSNINDTTFDTTIANTLTIDARWGSAKTNNSITTQIFNLSQIY